MNDHAEMFRALAAPFEPSEIEWKAQTAKDNRALAVAYIDARCVEDRLDRVVGPFGWEDEYVLLPDGNVECRLSIWVGDQKRTKADVGGESDQRDVGDKRKASYSDALKRAAVKWGIGRYLYSLPAQWVDYDPQRKQLKGTPRLPDWALPGKGQGQHTPAAPAQPEREPGADEDEECVNEAQAAELGRLIAAKDKTVESAVLWLDLPGETKLADLTVAQYRKLKEALSPKTRRAPQHREPARAGN